jgi:hypothetical protein
MAAPVVERLAIAALTIHQRATVRQLVNAGPAGLKVASLHPGTRSSIEGLTKHGLVRYKPGPADQPREACYLATDDAREVDGLIAKWAATVGA